MSAPAPGEPFDLCGRDRRRFPRRTVDLGVRLKGPRGAMEARAQNLSAGGALLCVRERDLCAVRPIAERSACVSVMERFVGYSVALHFLDRPLDVRARLVRLSLVPGDRDRLHVACRFPVPLGAVQLERLCGPDAPEADPKPNVEDAPEPGPTAARVRARWTWGEGWEGTEGVLLAHDDGMVMARMPTLPPRIAAALLDGPPHELAIAWDGGESWRGSARLTAVAVRDGSRSAVDLGYVAESPPIVVTRPYAPPGAADASTR